MASLSIPVSEWDVWTIRAIGIEDAPDDCEKVAQPAFFKGSLYRGAAIALAEPFPVHMGMSNTLICACGIRFKGNNAVRTGVVQLSELAYLQLDPKWPQIDILQANRLSTYRDGVPFIIKLEVAELFLHLVQVFDQRRQRWHALPGRFCKLLDS